MTKLTLSRLTPLLLLSVSLACVTAAKSPSHKTDYDATAVTNVCEAGEDSSLQQDAGNDSDTDVVASVEDASVEVKVDTTPIFIDYIYTAMKSWLPPKDQCYWDPNQAKYQACIDAADSFYKEIATTIVEVISEPEIQLPFIGNNIKVKSALLMTSIASTEGRFQKKVDNCQIVGDNGIAFGLWQTHTPRSTTCNDRKLALRQALKIVNQSFDACKNFALVNRLAAYASGTCNNERGQWHSKRKMNRAIDYLAAHPYTEQ